MSVFATSFEPYGAGRRAGVGALLPATLKAKMIAYKRNVARRYRIVTPDRIQELIPEGDLHISTKVDGELWFLCKLGGEVALCSPSGRVLEGIPVCVEAAGQLAACGDIVVAGELFAVVKGSRSRVKDCARALGDGALASTLGFKAFDLLGEGEEDWQKRGYADRFRRLRELFGAGRRCAVVETVEGRVDAVHARFDEWVLSGAFEGLVVRPDQGQVFKVKNTIDVDVVVLGFGEHRTAESAEVRDLVVGLLREDGDWQVLGTVGSGISPAERLAWMRRLEPMVVPSQFRMANQDGMLCRWVRPEIVIQLKVSDIVDSDSRDAPIRRMVLRHDESGYTPNGVVEFVYLLHPVFVRERPDKPVDLGHVGIEQVLAWLPLEEVEVESTTALPRATVADRRVWTKGGKGGTAVRKYVLIETHKQDEEHPPWVVFFTDWSAGRKEPLQTNLRVASTREAVDRIVLEWVTENVKKGWEEVR